MNGQVLFMENQYKGPDIDRVKTQEIKPGCGFCMCSLKLLRGDGLHMKNISLHRSGAQRQEVLSKVLADARDDPIRGQ